MSTLEWSILRVVFRVLYFRFVSLQGVDYLLTRSLIVIATDWILQVHIRQEGRIVKSASNVQCWTV